MITRVLEWGRERQREGGSQRRTQLDDADFEDEGATNGGGDSLEAGKVRKWILLKHLQKEHTTHISILAISDPFGTSFKFLTSRTVK